MNLILNRCYELAFCVFSRVEPSKYRLSSGNQYNLWCVYQTIFADPLSGIQNKLGEIVLINICRKNPKILFLFGFCGRGC